MAEKSKTIDPADQIIRYLDALSKVVGDVVRDSERYPCVHKDVDHVPVRASGVYMFWNVKEMRMAYAGTAQDLRGRLRTHMRINWLISGKPNLKISTLQRGYFQREYSEWNREWAKDGKHEDYIDFDTWLYRLHAKDKKGLDGVWKRVIKKHEFSFIVCPVEYRHAIESVVIHQYAPEFNG